MSIIHVQVYSNPNAFVDKIKLVVFLLVYTYKCMYNNLFSGEAEHVEMVLDDVVVEVSKHRGIGRVYLTDYRLVIICSPSGHTAAGHTTVSFVVYQRISCLCIISTK